MQIYGKLPLAFTKHFFLFHFFLICDFVVVELSCLFGSLVEGVFVVVCECICICCRWIELVIWLVGRVCARWIQVEGAHLWPRPVPISTESLPIVIIVITRPKSTYRPARPSGLEPGAKILFKLDRSILGCSQCLVWRLRIITISTERTLTSANLENECKIAPFKKIKINNVLESAKRDLSNYK